MSPQKKYCFNMGETRSRALNNSKKQVRSSRILELYHSATDASSLAGDI